MWKTLRRLFWLSALGGGGFAAFSWYQQRNDALAAPQAPEWPPLDSASPGTVADTSADTSTDSSSDATTDSPPAAVQGFAAVAPADDAPGPAPEPAVPEPATVATATASGDQRWVDPIDGECPAGYPIKANDNSGIYHVPGGRSYERTRAERCYASAADAEADGYRAAKA